MAVLGAGSTLSISTDGGTTFTQIKGIQGLGSTGQTKPEVDVTPLESTSKEFIAGMSEGESKSITVFRETGDPGQTTLKAQAVAGNNATFRINFNNGEVATFDMALLGWALDEPSGDNAITATVTARMTGDITWA